MTTEKLALLDVDGTLAQGYYIWKFASFLKKKDYFPTDSYNIMQEILSNYSNGEISYEQFARDWVTFFGNGISGREVEAVREMGDVYIKNNRGEKFPFTDELISHLNGRGLHTLAVSASPMDIIEFFCEDVGIKEALATTYKKEGGLYTGEVDKTYAGGSKMDAIIKYLYNKGLSEIIFRYSDCLGFGNTDHDDFLNGKQKYRPKYRFAINPTPDLMAKEEEWGFTPCGIENVLEIVKSALEG